MIFLNTDTGYWEFTDSDLANGVDISWSATSSISTYTSIGWEFYTGYSNHRTTWGMSELPYRTYVSPPPTLNFPNLSKGQNTKDGIDITESQAKQRSTYESVGWDFTEIWYLMEGERTPQFLVQYFGTPFTTLASLVKVQVDESRQRGSMLFEEIVYEYLDVKERKDEYTGVDGEQVTHTYFGDTVLIDGVKHRFLASGIQMAGTLGGFGDYRFEKSRTVTLHGRGSSVANFYYIEGTLFDKISELHIQTPTGVVVIPIGRLEEGSTEPLRVQTPTQIGYIPLVDVTDPMASPLRVQLLDSIKSITKE